MSKKSPWSVQDLLNRVSPGAAEAGLGDIVNDLVTQVNNLQADIAVLYAKLNADAGVTDVNYGAAATAKAVTTLANR